MIRGGLAMLLLMGYGIVSALLLGIALLSVIGSPGVILGGIGFVSFTAFYPVAVLYLALHSVFAVRRVIKYIEDYARENR